MTTAEGLVDVYSAIGMDTREAWDFDFAEETVVAWEHTIHHHCNGEWSIGELEVRQGEDGPWLFREVHQTESDGALP